MIRNKEAKQTQNDNISDDSDLEENDNFELDSDPRFVAPQLGFGENDISDGEVSGSDAEEDEVEDQNAKKDSKNPDPKNMPTVDSAKKQLLEKVAQSKYMNQFDPYSNAPKLVLIQGPPKSGKSTLIKSLIKHYTNQTIKDPKGPITIKTSKKQRITLLECPNQINIMTDLAKIPDIVLTMIDASLGFEMQTFEFCAMMQIHGFPKCMGIATHMDFYSENKKKRKVKKVLKKRFEIEVSEDTKLFFTGGFQNNQYLYRDVHNIARFISTMNPREADFKQSHPHFLVDRFDLVSKHNNDLNDNSLVDVALFGYCRGGDFKLDQNVYLTGLGFLSPSAIEEANDPVKLNEPTPKKSKIGEIVEESSGEEDENDSSDEENDIKRRNPKKSLKKSKAKVGQLRKSLKKFEKLIYAPQSNVGMLMFDETGDYVTIPDKYVVFTKTENQTNEIDQHEGVQIMRQMHNPTKTIKEQLDQGDTFLLDGVHLEEQEDEHKNPFAKSHKELALVNELAQKVMTDTNFQKGTNALKTKSLKSSSLSNIIYEQFNFSLFEQKNTSSTGVFNDIPIPARKPLDSSKFYSSSFHSLEFYKEKLRCKFVTGYAENENSDAEKTDEEDYKRIYQNENKDDQAGFLKESDKLSIKKGKYLKVIIRGLRFSIYKNFAEIPLIVSQFLYGENSRGFLLVKFKRHRFYRNILKSNDPIIVSIGLHKFQTLPYFCKKDASERLRLIKYTPKYDFCLCVFYSNYLPVNMGLIAYQTLDEGMKKFRVAATGVVIGFSTDYKVKKKLKLIGEPYKVFKNTAFIKGMFNSELEAVKFVGAKIKTVSGIRGQIKKSVREGDEGSFRANFEDKIIMSDIVFLRTWYSLTLEKFYNPIVSFNQQVLLKTTWQLRNKHGITNKDANYQYPEVERPNKRFGSLRVPKSIKTELPFKTQEKKTVLEQERALFKTENKVVKAISSEKEKEARYFIQRLKLIEKEKKKTDKVKTDSKRKWKQQWDDGMNKKLILKKKMAMKQKYKEMGKKKSKREEND